MRPQEKIERIADVLRRECNIKGPDALEYRMISWRMIQMPEAFKKALEEVDRLS